MLWVDNSQKPKIGDHGLCVFLLQPEWKLADPICTFVFSIIVLITTIHILRDILVVLMEGTIHSSHPIVLCIDVCMFICTSTTM